MEKDERNSEENRTFAKELGFPDDEKWLEEVTDIFAEFSDSHHQCLGRLAQSFLLGEGCNDTSFVKLYKAIGDNDLHAPIMELLAFFTHVGFLKGVQTGEARTVDNAERDASIKRLLRDIEGVVPEDSG